MKTIKLPIVLSTIAMIAGCFSGAPEGLAPATPAATTVEFDLFHRPLPEIPLPNDIATRFDASSPTKRRINASMVAPTAMESRVRRLIDDLDGWGTLQPITIPFSGPIDVQSILDGHRDANYDPSNDVIYLINVDRNSPNFGRLEHLDIGEGNYPAVLEDVNGYWKNDARGWTLSILFEEEDEDVNGNGVLDPGEDTDADGLLDRPNYLPGQSPARDDMPGRADALMTFYERQTNTVIANTLVPLDERTTYAVVVTKRLKDENGDAVGSPFAGINHTAQTEALSALPEALPDGLTIDDIAFTFSFTTQSAEAPMVALRDGLYGHGVQAHIGKAFPAEVDELMPLRDPKEFKSMKNPYIAYGETWRDAVLVIAENFQGKKRDSVFMKTVQQQLQYVDYFVVGKFKSPQLFERKDEEGNWLPLDAQSWPKDLDRVPAFPRSEDVYFTLVVPRKEVSNRGEGKPADVVILSHGYTGNRFDAINFAGILARHGLATIAIDGPSHGLSVTPLQRELALGLMQGYGLYPFGQAVFKDRAYDWNNDETMDSGADFWTSYIFHTRDMVRQFALDYMQLVRVIRSFDGTKRWNFDVNGDGENELAGDFDADGQIDIGVGSYLSCVGGSLGGMMAEVMGGMEPEIEAVIPISGGGKLANIGIRSKQGGVREAFTLRVMGPLFVGTQDGDEMVLETIVPDLNDDATIEINRVSGIEPGDTMVAENLNNGERGCAYVSSTGAVRTGVASDLGDRVELQFYAGDALLLGSEECELKEGATPKTVVKTFSEEFEFQGLLYEKDAPLVAIAEGLGLRRAHPDLRKFAGFGQLGLDSADPAVWARHIQKDPITFPGTGQKTGAHALVITTIGDMSVPASSGMTIARSAGLLPYLEEDLRYGKPVNQVLLDNHVAESVNNINRYVRASDGQGIHIDVENFGQGTDHFGADQPRLDPPVRLGFNSTDRLGGKSAAIFPMPNPTGEHVFDPPGEMTDSVQRRCMNTCTSTVGEDPCGCGAVQTFDIGHFMFNMSGRWMRSHGQVLETDLCQSRDDCPDLLTPPDLRDVDVME